MVVGEANAPTATPVARPPGVSQDKIDNIMGGISNTGAVKMNNHRKKLRQRFDIIKKLGQGTYGKVQLGINKETGQEVAIKTIKKCKIEAEADLIRIRREVQIMSSVQHPNIIHIYEVFENREKMVLVMEFAAGGELYDYLSERKVLSEEEARRIFRQVSTAVYYCHKHKICHRDLKLENILLDENGNAKIADFGLSNVFDDQRLLATFCGSPLYASPEIVKGTPYQGPEVDCWSLGVLLYTLVYGSMPFDGSNFKRLVKQISQGDYYEPKKPSRASPLIREMLTVCPQRRATIEQICNHWWVNETYKESCLDLAEDLANQTPVRLDVLLSLSPTSITADQLVVPSADSTKNNERVPRSHSVGSIRDMGNTEAERRILDMVAAGGEAALMPSPTRTITPTQSPVQSKRKLETTISTENATGAVKKKERPTETVANDTAKQSITEMEVDETLADKKPESTESEATPESLEKIEKICEELIENSSPADAELEKKPVIKQKTLTKLDSVKEAEEAAEETNPTKVIKKFVNKHKTADLVAAITKISPDKTEEIQKSRTGHERKNSLPDEALGKLTERRRSRILETAEKFQNMNNLNNDKPKKIIIPGVSVGNFKKEFERKASLTNTTITPAEKRLLEKRSQSVDQSPEKFSGTSESASPEEKPVPVDTSKTHSEKVEPSDSKSSLVNFSLEEARRSMENSIALLNQAKDETTKEVDQLCAKTENVAVSDQGTDREKKLKNAREIIGNAIQPGGRLCMGVRKPPVPFGINGRSISGSVVPSLSTEKRPIKAPLVEPVATENREPLNTDITQQPNAVKTSRAEITLKSATLPRRKTTKSEIQLDIKPKIVEQPMRFSTEMQHQVPDLRSAPVREGPYSPISTSIHQRATSLEPQTREHIIPIQKPPSYARTSSNSFRSGSLSRQSTNDSDTDTTTTQSQSTIPGSSQPIKKSPREFIIPIAVEGGGFITPRSGSLEPSESNLNSSSTFSRISRPRKVPSLLTEADSEEESPFQKIRTPSITRDGDNEEPRFILHRLSRSSRPTKKLSQDTNDSQSSGEDDDEDGFEILTAENLFSTLLQRVRALTNRLNVNNDITSGFSNSRLLNNMRQSHSPFWHQEPFGRSQFSYSYKSETVEKKQIRLNSSAGAPWRHSMSRDIGSDMDSMFSRTGATLPRGKNKNISTAEKGTDKRIKEDEPLDLADLDLSRLRLTKKDLETLSSITPGLPKCFQDQLLAKLPPTQARKLSRTLSMQNNAQTAPIKIYKRSYSGGRELDEMTPTNDNKMFFKDSSDKEIPQKQAELSREESSDRSGILYRRSASRGRCEYDTDSKSRSTSTCKISDDLSRSLCSSYSSDVSEKYKYYSPYLGKRNDVERAVSPYKTYDSTQRNSCLSPTKELYGRPPSGCLSPPPCTPDSSLRRRSSQRRISRFLRPDFFEPPASRDENPYIREKKQRERETQSVLKEIRERSRERSRDRRSSVLDTDVRKENYIDPNPIYNNEPVVNLRHVRNKSLERFCDPLDIDKDITHERRRSLSRPKDLPDEKNDYYGKSELANKILEELQILSVAQNKCDQLEKELAPPAETIVKDKSSSRIRKVKSREKSDENAQQVETLQKANASSVIKKVTKTKRDKKVDNNVIESNSKNTNVEAIKIIDSDKMKKESKLIRPKSYPSKVPDKLSLVNVPSTDDLTVEKESDIGSKINDNELQECKIVRPKSFPNTKITPPKEVKKATRSNATISAVMDKLIEKNEKAVSLIKPVSSKSNITEEKSASSKSSDTSSTETKTTVKKIVKVKKPKTEIDQKVPEKSPTKDPIPSGIPTPKEKSPEKKTGKGILYAIGQKFEKLRESSRNKDKKSTTNVLETLTKEASSETVGKAKSSVKKKKTKPVTEETTTEKQEESKTDKKSRIDTMIRSLRERSVPRAPVMTESGLIKRAVSVEDMSGAFNKSGVNKVLGLFKRFEKDGVERKVLNTRSTSNIERQMKDAFVQKDRPKSGGFVSKLRKNPINLLTNKNEIQNDDDSPANKKVETSFLPDNSTSCINNKCPDCNHEEPKNNGVQEFKPPISDKNCIKDKKKGLSLDLSKLDNASSKQKVYMNGNHVTDYSNLSYGNYNNNNTYSSFGSHEINRNLLTPSIENIANYSSDSRSPHDDYASSSTFLSPTDEPELCFDNWSVCSEDNFVVNTPSPTVSRLSRTSQISSPTCQDNHLESVIDRIKRRSFYCRFNEKKPKRQSNIVGTAARDYYRETAAKLRSRPPDRVPSPEIETHRSQNDYSKPLKLSSAAADLKPPHFKSSTDYSKPRKSLNDIYPPTSTSTKKFLDTDTYLRNRTTAIDTNNSVYSNTYNPKRRSSFNLNGVVPTGTSNIDGYATLGRKIRPYDHRSISLLDSNHDSTSTGILRWDQRASEFGSIPRSNLHIRTPSVSRSPTNI